MTAAAAPSLAMPAAVRDRGPAWQQCLSEFLPFLLLTDNAFNWTKRPVRRAAFSRARAEFRHAPPKAAPSAPSSVTITRKPHPSRVGSCMVIVDAIDEHAVGFYSAHGLIRLPESMRLILPMHTLAIVRD